jgi:hypothetical protein
VTPKRPEQCFGRFFYDIFFEGLFVGLAKRSYERTRKCNSAIDEPMQDNQIFTPNKNVVQIALITFKHNPG